MSDLLAKLYDLKIQATTEKTHFYVAACLTRAINEIERLRERIEEAESLIAHAVQIMSHEQVGKWTGVRAWQEGGEDE